MPKVAGRWRGDEFELRWKRATGRAIISIGVNIATLAKVYAHVISGTLKRSIHTAPTDYNPAMDEELALLFDIPNTPDDWRDTYKRTSRDAVILVGSWLPYACVEEVGRGHRFIGPAVEEMQGAPSDEIVRQAFREEGLL